MTFTDFDIVNREHPKPNILKGRKVLIKTVKEKYAYLTMLRKVDELGNDLYYFLFNNVEMVNSIMPKINGYGKYEAVLPKEWADALKGISTFDLVHDEDVPEYYGVIYRIE